MTLNGDISRLEARSSPSPGPVGGGPDALVGRRVQLSPVATRHYDLLYEWVGRGEIPWQWRGLPVSPEGLRQSMWAEVLLHFMVEARDSLQPVGLVTAYGANFHHQHCYLQAGIIGSYRSLGWPFESLVLLMSVVFRRYNMRCIYAQATSETFRQFRLGEGTWFEVEGRLKEHVYVDGRFLDSYILTVTRDRFETRILPVVQRWHAARPVEAPELALAEIEA